MRRVITIISALLLAGTTGLAQGRTEATDTLAAVFYFRQSEGVLDRWYMDNDTQLRSLKEAVLTRGDVRAREIICLSSASPEGSYRGNTSLALSRSASICDMLEEEFPFMTGPQTQRQTELTSENWAEVRRRLSTSGIEGRDEALRLIQAVGSRVDETASSALKTALKSLHKGRTWELMKREIFPYTRCVYTRIIFEDTAPEPSPGTDAAPAASPALDTAALAASLRDMFLREGWVPGGSVQEAPAASPSLDTAALAASLRGILLSEGWVPGGSTYVYRREPGRPARGKDRERKPFMALKTNLLLDLASAVNVEVEFPIRNRYSVMIEHTCPWWLFHINNRDYALEVLRTGVEVRRYLGNRTQKPLLAGTFMGVYANAAYFDVEWRERGMQGETFTDFGLTLGYSKKIGTNWRMEFSLGAGYFSTPYTKYKHNQDNGLLIYQKDDRLTWIGPTKLKCSICWLLPNYPKARKGDKR